MEIVTLSLSRLHTQVRNCRQIEGKNEKAKIKKKRNQLNVTI